MRAVAVAVAVAVESIRRQGVRNQARLNLTRPAGGVCSFGICGNLRTTAPPP